MPKFSNRQALREGPAAAPRGRPGLRRSGGGRPGEQLRRARPPGPLPELGAAPGAPAAPGGAGMGSPSPRSRAERPEPPRRGCSGSAAGFGGERGEEAGPGGALTAAPGAGSAAGRPQSCERGEAAAPRPAARAAPPPSASKSRGWAEHSAPRCRPAAHGEGAGRLPAIHPGHSLYGGRPAPPASCTGRPAPARPIPAARPPPPAPSSAARPAPAPRPALQPGATNRSAPHLHPAAPRLADWLRRAAGLARPALATPRPGSAGAAAVGAAPGPGERRRRRGHGHGTGTGTGRCSGPCPARSAPQLAGPVPPVRPTAGHRRLRPRGVRPGISAPPSGLRLGAGGSSPCRDPAGAGAGSAPPSGPGVSSGPFPWQRAAGLWCQRSPRALPPTCSGA